MNDNLRQLEEELRRISPKPLSAELRSRIAGELQRSNGNLIFWPKSGWGWVRSAAGAAAALLIAAIGVTQVWRPAGDPGQPPLLASGEQTNVTSGAVAALDVTPRHIAVKRSRRVPIAMESVLVAEDRSLPVFVSNNVPLQPVRRHYVDHTRWHDREKGVSYTVTVPRQEIVLVGMETN